MQDFLLLTSVVAVFIFSWFLLKRLDEFINKNEQAQAEQLEIDDNALRIGFVNPLVADSISDNLEQYSRQYPDVSIFLFYGAVEALLKKVTLYKLDIVILPEQVDIPFNKDYYLKETMMTLNPVIMKYGEFPIEPEVSGSSKQIILWMKQNKAYAVQGFMKYMDEISCMN